MDQDDLDIFIEIFGAENVFVFDGEKTMDMKNKLLEVAAQVTTVDQAEIIKAGVMQIIGLEDKVAKLEMIIRERELPPESHGSNRLEHD